MDRKPYKFGLLVFTKQEPDMANWFDQLLLQRLDDLMD